MLFRKMCKLRDVNNACGISMQVYVTTTVPFPPRPRLSPKRLLQLWWFLKTCASRMDAQHRVAEINTCQKLKAGAGLLNTTMGVNVMVRYEIVSLLNTVRAHWAWAQQNKTSTSLCVKQAHQKQCIVHPSKSCSCAQDSGVWMSELGH